MVARTALSTRELMRLVVLSACNLALFQGAWLIVLFPPITMLFVILNLTLYWAWVRRRRISRPLLCALLMGLWMSVMLFMFMPMLGPFFPTLSRWYDFAMIDLQGFGIMAVAGWAVAARERSRRRRREAAVGRRS
jgi:hypothetical protein